jgi:hypothetical protein
LVNDPSFTAVPGPFSRPELGIGFGRTDLSSERSTCLMATIQTRSAVSLPAVTIPCFYQKLASYGKLQFALFLASSGFGINPCVQYRLGY